MSETYNVCQFFENEAYEYVRRAVTPEEAVQAAIHYSTSVGAKLGTTVRVIVTDGGDSIAWEWKRAEGVVYPPGYEGWLAGGERGAKPLNRQESDGV